MNINALQEKGFTEEQATTILNLHKEAISGNYIPKDTFDAEREKVKALNTQVEERDKQITELGAFKGTADELNAKVAKLEEANKEAVAKHEAEMARVSKETAVKLHIINSVHDPEDVISRLDMEMIKVDNNEVKTGLEEQLNKLKESKPHYFKETPTAETTKPAGWQPFGTPPAESAQNKDQEASSFGKALAQKQINSQAADAIQEQYFK